MPLETDAGNVPIISVVGLKKSGKTTTVEHIVKYLVQRGYRVGTIKSMVHSNFTIDMEGKDTYRHKTAGAGFVISLSRNETAYIENNPKRQTIDEVSKLFPDDTDVVVAEGLHDTGPGIYQLVALRERGLYGSTLKVRNIGENVVALTGIFSMDMKMHEGIPVVDATNLSALDSFMEILLPKLGLAPEALNIDIR